VLTWTPSEELTTYANVSNGYKPGGLTFNEQFGTTVPFRKESMWNYELGVKWRGLDNRVQVNAAVFYMDWEDLQIPSVEIQIVDNVILNNFVLDNIKAESKGFEIEMQGLATDQFLIGGSVGYLKAKFKEFGPDDPFVINNNGFALDGVTIPRAPEWTINLFGQYDFTIGDKPAWFRAEWSYRASTTSDIEAVVAGLPILDNAVTQERGLDTSFNGNGFGNGVPFPWPRDGFPTQVPSYDVVNIRAGISGERWAVNIYVENLFDDNYYTGTQENFGLGGFRVRPHFRVAGIKVRFFNE
jgi:iron complex outermembrane receptor protein